MSRRKDTSEAIRIVEVVDQSLRQTSDGRTVLPISEYGDSPWTPDGRPIRAISVDAAVKAKGGPVDAVSLWPQGTLATPDGRPVHARRFFDAAGDAVTYGQAQAAPVMLMEDGSYRLREDGFRIQREA